MASTFSSAQHFVGPISDNYRIGIQCGQSTGSSAPALAEMKWITMEEFKTYARQGLGNMANYRGAYSDALPENAVQNDYFNATATFTVSGVTYTSGHVYEYNGSTWGDVTGIFAQFCTLQQAIAAAQSQINELALLKTQLAQTLSSDEDKVPSNKCVDDAINAINTQLDGIKIKCSMLYNGSQTIENVEHGALFIYRPSEGLGATYYIRTNENTYYANPALTYPNLAITFNGSNVILTEIGYTTLFYIFMYHPQS